MHLLNKFIVKLLICVCLLFYCAISFGQKQDKLLFHAYSSNSLIELQQFFDNWAAESKRDTAKSILNDTIKNVYQVFQVFYTPKDINKTGGSEWGNDIYKDANYLLVQDEINYAVVDSLVKVSTRRSDYGFKGAEHYDTLKNFRPQISISDAKTVVLTSSYDMLLNRFLENEHDKFATGDIMSPAKAKGESEKRKLFLENYIKIWYGHWGGYWQLHSYPVAETIIFDKEFKSAVVNYTMVYEGGYAYFQKVNGEWTLVNARRTWIE